MLNLIDYECRGGNILVVGIGFMSFSFVVN